MKKLYFLLAFVILSVSAFASDLYWVGGTGSWNDNSHWSYSSGGHGGASIPGPGDNVIFNENSFPAYGTLTLDGVMHCHDLKFTGSAGLIEMKGNGEIFISGSLEFSQQLLNRFSGKYHLTGEGSIRSASEISGDVFIETVYPKTYKAGTTLRFNETYTFRLISGGFNTNEQSITFGRFIATGNSARSLELTSSKIYVNKGWDLSETNGLDFNAGTSRIRPSKFVSESDLRPGNVAYNQFVSPLNNSCPPLNLVTGFTPSPCNNDNTAFAWVTATGCTGPYTYSWNSNNATAFNDTTFNLPPGTYTITVTCDNGEFCDDDVFVTEPAAVRFNSINIVNPTCFATCNGSATVNTGGGTSPRTITWYSFPGMTQLATGVNNLGGLCSGQSYLIRVTDSKNCTKDSVITIANPTQVLPNITSTNVTCKSFCDGSATSSPTGGNGASYTYSWSTGATTPSIAPLCPGTYTVTVTDASNCTNTQSVIITEPPLLTATTALTNPTCNNTCDGTISLTMAGGTPGYTYSWSDGITTEDRTNLCGGPYSVEITDANGCNVIRNLSLTTPPPLPIVATGDTICFGNSAQITATGAGTGGTYTWDPGNLVGASVTVTPGSTTTYTVTGTSSAQCANTDIAIVVVNQLPTIQATPSSASICTGTCVSITASGAGTGTYTWNPGPIAGPSIAPCPTANTTYTVTGTDANGCRNTATAEITVNQLPTIVTSPTNVNICFGASTNLSASGAGTGGTYEWSPNALTGTPVTVSPTVTTTYTVTGTSASTNCTNTATSIVTVMPLPVANATASPAAICLGTSTTLTASSGVVYTWSPTTFPSSGTPVTATPTTTTTYTVTVTGSNGCTDTAQVQVIVNPLPSVSATPLSSSICSGSSQTIVASGAVTYSWTPATVPATGSTVVASPTATTTYTVTGTDNIGCRDTGIAIVNVNPLPVVTVNPTNSNICIGLTATLTASGAGASGTYNWNPGSGTGPSITVSPVSTTTYTVTGTDANGCRDTAVSIVTISNPFNVSVSATPNAICTGATASLSATGAGPTGVYVWNPGALPGANVTVNPTSTTTYTVTASNSTGCQDIDTVIVNVNPLPSIGISPANPSVCIGACTNITATGGVSYVWNPGGSTNPVFNVCPVVTSTYTVTGTDANGCVNVASSPVVVNPLPTITATPTQTAVCIGSSTLLSATGAGAVGTYEWNPGGFTGSPVSVSPLVATTYTVTGTDANGCTSTSTSIVNVNPLPVITGSATPAIICIGNSSLLFASGAGAGGSYEWNPGGMTSSTANVTPGVTTTYTVTGTNSNGCVNTDTAVVTVTPLPSVTATAANSPICIGSSTTLTASGATNYSWTPVSTVSPTTGAVVTATPTAATTYTVTGTTAGGCMGSAEVFVNTNALPTITVSPATSVICVGDSITLTGSGGVTYTWSPGSSLSSTSGTSVWASPLATSTYTVTGTDANGCWNTATAIVNVNSLPTVTATPANTTICPGACVSISATGAGTGATYTWSPSAGLNTTSGTNVTACPAATTTYTVVGEDQFGCGGVATSIINVTATPVVTITPSNTPICAGSSVTLNASGAGTYSWSPSATLNTASGTTVVATPSTTTTYTVTGTTGLGCPGTGTAIVNVMPLPVVTINPSATTICVGSSLTLTGIGASTYSWTPSSQTGTTVTVTPGVQTTYTVTGTASNGCTDTSTVFISVVTAPVISAGANKAMCLGSNVTLNATGATGGSYNWTPVTALSNPASSSPVAFPSVTTTYTVTGTNSSGCTNTDEVIVTVNVPSISAGPDVAMCNGSGATLNASGGTTYVWSPPVYLSDPNISNPLASPPSQSTYTVTGTDANGCSASDFAIVTPDTIEVALTVYNTSGCGNTDGSIVATPSDGIAPYTYSWSCSPSTTDSISSLSAGVCTVTVTDAGGCIATQSGTVSDPVNITAGFAVTNTTTCSGNDGSITITPSGGVGAYTFNWTGPGSFSSTSQNISGLSAGVYFVSITDENNCTAVFNDTVFEPTPSPITVTPVAVMICPGASVQLTATTGFVSYSWSPAGTLNNPSISNPVATPANTTVYSVTGIDANQCSSTAFSTISVTAPIAVDAGTDQTVCPGGSVTLAGSGGGPTGTYSWTPDPALSATNIPNPVATVNVTTTFTMTVNISSCTNSDMVVVKVEPMALSSTKSNVTACGGNNGSLTVSASGGTSPYTYSWNTVPSQTTATATGLTVGIYSVLVSDAGGCSATLTDSISEPATFTISETHTNSTTCNADDGTIDVTVNGGTAPYTYTWAGCSISSTLPNVTGLEACTYTITVTDATGCTGIRSVIISEPAPTPVSAGSDVSVCTGSSTGLSVTNVPGALFAWSPSASLSDPSIFNPVASPSATTTYTVSVTDANGCVSSDNVTVNVTSLSLSATTTNTSSCGVSDGSATVTVSGGTVPFTYSWSDGQTNATATNLGVGAYSVVVNDNLGCTDTLTGIFVSSPVSFTATSVATPTSTCTSADGTITVTVNAATPPVTYTWSPSGSGASSSGLAPGIYTILVVDSNGCSFVVTDTVFNPTPAVVNAGNDVAICNGTSFPLTASAGGTTYEWSPATGITPSTGQTVTASPTTTTTYTVTMTDANSCVDTDMVVVTVVNIPTVNAGFDVNMCAGTSSSLNVLTNGTSVLWNPGTGLSATNISNPIASPTVTTTYTLTAYNNAGCANTDEVIVNVFDLQVAVSDVDATSCGSADGSATAIASGGTGSYSYLWSPGNQTSSSISNLQGGIYNVTVTDANVGCSVTGVATVDEPASFTLSSVSTNITTCTGVDGTIDLTVSGSTGPYSYSWNNGQMSEDLTGLSAGVYSVSVTDTNGCTRTLSDTITAPASITVNAGNNVTVCIGDTVTLEAITSAVNPVYSWTPAGSLSNASAPDPTLIAATNQQYVVTVTDQFGCTGVDSVVVTVSNIALGASITNTTTCAATDGIVNLNVTGGTSPYTYSWTGPSPFTASTEDLTGVGSGVYSVTVTDAGGCSDTASFPVSEPSGITVTLDSTLAADNCGGNTGAIYVSVSGGSVPYTYSWTGSTNSTSEDITALSTGTYNLLVTDATGCSTAFTATLSVPVQQTVYAGNDASACLNDSVQLSANGVASYTWSPATGLSSTSIANPKAAPSSTTTYTVTGTDANGCISTDTIIVNINALPVADAGSDVSVCPGSSATLTATGGITYSWMPASGLSDPNAAITQVLNVTVASTYSVEVTDANGCRNTDTVVVNLYSLPVVDAGPSTSVCNSTCAQLSGSSVPAAATYSWSPAASLDDATISGPQACPAATTTYTLTITDVNGCSNTDTMVVNVVPATQISAGPDLSLCPDFELTLTASAGFTGYEWSPSTFLSCTGCASPIVDPSATTTYTVTGTDNLGCATTDTVIVTVAPLAISSNIVQPTDCYTNNGVIALSTSGGTSPYSYSWNNGLVNDTIQVTAGNYSVIITDILGCTDTSSYEILSLTPVIADAGADTSFCEGADFTLDGSGTIGASQFQWSVLPANTVVSTFQSPVITPPLGQTVYVLYASNGFCNDRDSVTVMSAGVPVADAGTDITIILNTTGVIGGTPTATGGSQILWLPSEGLSDTSATNPVASPIVTTTYAVIVTNEFGCTDRDTMIVTVRPQISFPNGFTPNGDRHNEVWQIDNIDQFPEALVQVYNRWGELLFSSIGYKEPWDGTYKGEQVPVGTYYYIIDLNDDRFPEDYTGPLTIIR